MNIQSVKQRFGIIGNSPLLNRAIEIAIQVAPTHLSVLITGESGTGKEVMPQIIHQYGSRKHHSYIAVNCGAIPEGTIDSELFGHEKGSFTGAHDARKGYFEVANGGTIFLDEVAELPIQTQVRLLRVLETGEYMRVGSSKVQKTDVRIVAATNVNIPQAIEKGKFREDLYYRLNTVPIIVPALRDRQSDIHLLFRKFSFDFSEKYNMPAIELTPDAVALIEKYRWPGNIRQLKNITEQISIIENDRLIDANAIIKYLPQSTQSNLPMVLRSQESNAGSDMTERDILYKVLFEMRQDITDLKKLVYNIIKDDFKGVSVKNNNETLIKRIYDDMEDVGEMEEKNADSAIQLNSFYENKSNFNLNNKEIEDIEHQIEEEKINDTLSLADKEIELIKKALEKYNGKRKKAAQELGISERTLYRKIKELKFEKLF
jgi:transcriptional regulator with PAS, ATPase and Fis domain